jgi:dTDP-4-amino-4,6-dideoxygalactose transaminase
MKEIRMVDLQSQYQRLKSEIDKAIANVIGAANFIKGPEIKEFEANLALFLNVKHVISCANGTDALMIALMALGLKPGDEVITTAFTFIATVETISFLGLKPIMADVEPDTFNIDCKKIEKLITTKTKAILPVHLFGQCADMSELERLAEKYNLFVIEDAAQSLGADFIFANGTVKKSGTIGHIGCTSFFPSKNLGCFGDGGAMFTNDDTLAEKMKIIANHGMKTRYYHDVLGVNSRLDTIQAAILNVKLKYLKSFNDARIEASSKYDEGLKQIEELITPARSKFSNHIFHQYTLVIKNGKRDVLKKYLENSGVPCMIYYPVPLHLQKAIIYLGYKIGDFPVSEQLTREVISLPMHTELDDEQINFTTSTIKEFFSKNQDQ